jgi:PAS domain S-box-containing protein
MSDPYRLLFEANTQPMWMLDLDTLRFLAVNDAALRHYGYTREEFMAMSVLELRPSEDVTEFRDYLERLREHLPAIGQVVTRVRRHRRKDGHVIDVEVSWSRVACDGRNAAMVWASDVTERRLAEESLWESEARLRATVAAAPVVVWAVDREGIFTLSEGRGLASLGLRPGEVVGRSVFEVYRDHPQIQSDVRRALAGEDFTTSVRIGRVVFESRFAPWRNPDGALVGASGVAIDITERDRAERVRAALYRIAETTASAEDMSSFYAAIHSIVAELMYARNFYIALYDDVTGSLSFPYFVDEVDPEPPSIVGLGKSLTGYVLRTSRPLLCSPSVFRALAERGEIDLIGAPSLDWLGAPLKTSTRTFGVLAVQSYSESARYAEDDRELLSFVSRHVAAALERKRASEVLRASEERFRAIVEHTSDGIVLFDAFGRIRFASPAAGRIAGRAPEELLGQAAADFVHPDDLERVRAALAASLSAPGRLTSLECRWRTKQGGWRDVEVVAANHLGNPAIAAIVADLRDVTERTRAESELLAQRAFLRQVLDINPSFIFAKDRDGRFTLVNQAVAEAYGTTVEELVGKTDADFNPNADEVAHFRRDDLEVMDTRREKSIAEEVITDAAGRRRWLQTVKRPILGADGQARQVLGVATDVSERKRVEQALAESRQRYRRFFEQSPVVLFVARPDGTLLDCNPAFARLLGHASAEGARGSDLTACFAGPRTWATLLERLRNEGRLDLEELALRGIDGETVSVRASLVASLAGGELLEVQGCAVDLGGRPRKPAAGEA